MSLETINYISSAWFDWESNKKLNIYKGCKFKLLSQNHTLGQDTLLFKFPKNTYFKKNLTSKFDEEIYILNGSIKFSGNILNKDFYSYIPSGYEKKMFSSLNGATGIIFLNKQTKKTKKINNFYPNFFYEDWIPRINCFENIWSSPPNELKYIDLNNSGARINILRSDKTTNNKTFLVGFPPLWSFPEVCNLGGNLEIFLINGNVNNSKGPMRAGSYLRIPNGGFLSSMYSKESAVFLFKTSSEKLLLKRTKSNEKFNYQNMIKKNNSTIPKKILSKITSGPYFKKKL